MCLTRYATKHDSVSKGAYTPSEKKQVAKVRISKRSFDGFSYISVPESRFNFDDQYLDRRSSITLKAGFQVSIVI